MDEQLQVNKVNLFADRIYAERTNMNLALANRFEPEYITDKEVSYKEHTKRLETKYKLENDDRVVEICKNNEEQSALSNKDHKDIRKEREKEIKRAHKEFLETPKMQFDNPYGIRVEYDSTIIEKFTRDYVGNHYKEARTEIEKILLLEEKYNNGYTLFTVDSTGNDVPIDYDFSEFAQCCKNAFISALTANGLRYSQKNDSEFEVVEVSEQKNALNINSDDVKAIQRVFKEREYNKEVRQLDELIVNANQALGNDLTEADYENLLKRYVIENPLAKIDKLIAENADNYEANKRLIDNFYGETESVFKSLINEIYVAEYLEREKNNIGQNFDLLNHIRNKIDEIYKNIYKINIELNNLTDVMKLKLKGKELKDVHKEFLTSKYLANNEEFELDIKALCAKYSSNSYNTSHITDVKGELDNVCSKLKSDLTRLELVDMHEEIATLAKAVMEDVSVFTTGVEKLKVKKLLAYVDKSRAAVLLTGCKRRCIGLEDLTNAERLYIDRKIGKKDQENSILSYAKELYNRAEFLYHEEEQTFVKDDGNVESILKEMEKELEPLENNHPEFTKRYKELVFEKKKTEPIHIKESSIVSGTNPEQQRFYENLQKQTRDVINKNTNQTLELMYDQYKQRIELAKKQYNTTDELQGKLKIQKMIDSLSKEIAYLEIKKKMHDERFAVYGNKTVGISDYLIRSLSQYNNVYVYSQIPEDDMYQIMKKMSAGVYEKEETDETKREYYRTQNLEGIEMYKTYMRGHVKWLYKKYGTKCPDVAFICQHFAEMKRDFSTAQPDNEFIKQTDVLDENNMNDVMLREMLTYYFGMAKLVDSAFTLMVNDRDGFDYFNMMQDHWQRNGFDKIAVFIKSHEYLLKNF